jgi:hypothetical protein
MLVERGPIARIERDHRHCYGISLMFEEQGQVVCFDIS